jgi:hypothetical protein
MNVNNLGAAPSGSGAAEEQFFNVLGSRRVKLKKKI